MNTSCLYYYITMKYKFLFISLFLLLQAKGFSQIPTIVYFKDSNPIEHLAAKELQRYLYVRTGKLSALKTIASGETLSSNSILVAVKDEILSSPYYKNINLADSFTNDDFVLSSITSTQLFIVGASDIGCLYGVYKFIESTGIGFALDEDIIPDNKIRNINLSGFNKSYTPSFALRGIQPFHDFPEGPDWWNEDDYKAIITQLPKMGMNFIGFHTYPEKEPFEGKERAEPLVWIGTLNGFNSDGTVQTAYPVLHSNTNDSTWNYYPRRTSDFNFGAAQIFETDIYGADYMKNISKWPHTNEENKNIFNETGTLLNGAFTFAQNLHVKTCIGVETPLTVPAKIKDYLKLENKDVESDEVKQALYEGIFSRIKATHPLDYYWFWTPETWTWQKEKDIDIERTEKDLLNAIAAAKKVEVPFTLATCGWVLGPSRNRAEFDNLLPKEMPFGVINRQTGSSPVEPAFQNIQGRPKWQISWIEDDPALTAPQFWAGRILKDAVDAYKYGCTGFMGIHWRTKNLSPGFLALSKAGWEAADYIKPLPDTARDYPVSDLYMEWARPRFGEKAVDKIAAFFTGIDGSNLFMPGKNQLITKFPRPAEWGYHGPGRIILNKTPWKEEQKKYAFIQEFENLKSLIEGGGYKERYDYWLNNFYYTRAMGHIGCLLGEMDTVSKQLIMATGKIERTKFTKQLVLLRKTAAQLWSEMSTYLLQTVSTLGEMGTIANLEEHNLEYSKLLNNHDSLIKSVLGIITPLNFSKTYKGKSRLIITTKRTLLDVDEDMKMKVRILTNLEVQSATIYWKPFGTKKFKNKALIHDARNVYKVHLTSREFDKKDFEYYILIKLSSNNQLKYPVAENTFQTVVIW